MELARLSYFDLRGRAEPIRLLLRATQTDFEDHRVVSTGEWAELKPTLPFGGLPIFESDGRKLCESHAILRHLGRVLAGVDGDEARCTYLDATQDAIAEAQEELWRFAWIANWYDHLESYAESPLRTRVRRLSEWFTRSGNATQGWLSGDFSHVDCLAFCYLDEIDAFFPALLEDFPELSAYRSRVAASAGIADYLASDARPVVFGMGCMGPKIDPRVTRERGALFLSPWSEPIDLDPIARKQRRLTRVDGELKAR
jgi:glutathione S-transferase